MAPQKDKTADRPGKDPADAPGRQRATERARKADQAWKDHRAKRGGQPYVVRTRHGEVRLDAVEIHQDGDLAWVEVWAGGDAVGADPHFRIFNPPTLTEDPLGDVEIQGRRFREDPMAALAEAVARAGGAVQTKRKRRTQG